MKASLLALAKSIVLRLNLTRYTCAASSTVTVDFKLADIKLEKSVPGFRNY